MRRAGGALAVAFVLVLSQFPLLAQNRVQGEIPIHLDRNRVVIPVTVGLSAPLRLVLDSGMPYDGILLYDLAKVDRTHFDHLAEAQVGGAGEGNPSPALTDEAATFAVGPMKIENQRVTILTAETLKGFPTDGVIGYTLLGHYAVEVDYDKNRMILYEPSTFSPEEGWGTIDIYFKENRVPWTELCVATSGEDPVRLSTYIDCASGEALELLKRRRNVFRPPPRSRERLVGRGLSGDIYGREGRLAWVLLGAFTLTDVAALVIKAEGRSKQKGADAIIGNNILRRFNVVFDYAHQKVHLKPNRHFTEPF